MCRPKMWSRGGAKAFLRLLYTNTLWCVRWEVFPRPEYEFWDQVFALCEWRNGMWEAYPVFDARHFVNKDFPVGRSFYLTSHCV